MQERQSLAKPGSTGQPSDRQGPAVAKTGSTRKEQTSADEVASAHSESTNEAAETDTKGGVSRAKSGKLKDGKNSAVQKFMDSLESELGITAERLSAALAQLPPEIKALPMEQSAPFVIEQLGVPESQQTSSTDAYVNLLQDAGLGRQRGVDKQAVLNPFSMGEVLTPNGESSASLGKLNNQSSSGLESKLANRQKLNATIDDLNRRFFNVKSKTNEGERGKSEGLSLDGFTAVDEDSDLSKWLSQVGQQPLPESTPARAQRELNGPVPKLELEKMLMAPNELSTSGITSAEPIPMESSLVPRGDSLFEGLSQQSEMATLGNLNELESVANKNRLADVKNWSVEELPFLTNTDLNGLKEPSAAMGDASRDSGFSFSSSNLNDEALRELGDDSEMMDDLANEFVIPGGDAVSTPARPMQLSQINGGDLSLSPKDRIENLNKLSMAAESLAAKGGGEVKVILSPEGLGTVELKVKLHEGKVQVQMKAENQESQRLLESSLNELKQNLSSHRLAVDSVKVDVGGDFTRQDSQQAFNQQQFDQGRDQARQFMNQFRQENLFQRQGLFDAPGFKTYRSQREEPLAPISNEIRPRSSLGQNKGRELNLVA
jgi:flagellar hook-length control protein FliK